LIWAKTKVDIYKKADTVLNMNSTTVRCAKYNVTRDGRLVARCEFPNDVRSANFYDVCFYNPDTDTFLGTTEVRGFVLERVE
jgi:hypothetical protein